MDTSREEEDNMNLLNQIPLVEECDTEVANEEDETALESVVNEILAVSGAQTLSSTSPFLLTTSAAHNVRSSGANLILTGETLAESSGQTTIVCAACQLPIQDRYLLRALGADWHETCLQCSCCGCRLGEVGSSLYTRANLLLCKRDYLRLFGASGQCRICGQSIPGFEMVMRVKEHVYHVECFKCQQCRQKFSLGDKLYLCEGRILCEYDFEEQNLITSIQRGYNVMTHNRSCVKSNLTSQITQ